MQNPIGIIGAMEVEVQLLLSALTEKQEVHSGRLTFVKGLLDSKPVVVVRSGIGKVNAALCAERLITAFNARCIINTGIAGAMAKGLCVLDFVVSSDALYHDFDVRGFGYPICTIPQMEVSDFEADKDLIEVLKRSFEKLPATLVQGHKLIVGRIASGDQFISSVEQKERIRKDCNPACVEMEGAAIAHTCYLERVPFVIIRCMSDMADDASGKTYDFNEETAASMSAQLVRSFVRELS